MFVCQTNELAVRGNGLIDMVKSGARTSMGQPKIRGLYFIGKSSIVPVNSSSRVIYGHCVSVSRKKRSFSLRNNKGRAV